MNATYGSKVRLQQTEASNQMNQVDALPRTNSYERIGGSERIGPLFHGIQLCKSQHMTPLLGFSFCEMWNLILGCPPRLAIELWSEATDHVPTLAPFVLKP